MILQTRFYYRQLILAFCIVLMFGCSEDDADTAVAGSNSNDTGKIVTAGGSASKVAAKPSDLPAHQQMAKD